MTIHIGISGPIAAGKSTLARGLADIFDLMGYKAKIIPFATGLKYLATLYDNPQWHLRAFAYFIDLGYTREESIEGVMKLLEGFITYPIHDGVKPRKLFQFIGTEVGRDTVDKDVWIKAVQREIERQDLLDFVISDDMRFVNESAAVHLRIAITTEEQEKLYEARQAQFPKEYFYSDHPSEKERDLLYAPDFEIGIDSKTSDVIKLAKSVLLWADERNRSPVAQVSNVYAGFSYTIGKLSNGWTTVITSGTPTDFIPKTNHMDDVVTAKLHEYIFDAE